MSFFTFSNNSHILTKMIDSMNWDFRYTTEDGIKVFRLDNDSFPVIKIHKDIDSSMKIKFLILLEILIIII